MGGPGQVGERSRADRARHSCRHPQRLDASSPSSSLGFESFLVFFLQLFDSFFPALLSA